MGKYNKSVISLYKLFLVNSMISASDNQSLCSHESSSEAGMSSFPPGFPDIELYLEESDATHRGCHKFLPRHSEEIAVEIGDSLFVEKEHDDLWCEGEYEVFLHLIQCLSGINLNF